MALAVMFSSSLAVSAAAPVQERTDRFLKLANAGYQALYRVNSEAQWLAVTDVTPEHDAAVAQPAKLTPHSLATRPSSPKRTICSRTRKN